MTQSVMCTWLLLQSFCRLICDATGLRFYCRRFGILEALAASLLCQPLKVLHMSSRARLQMLPIFQVVGLKHMIQSVLEDGPTHKRHQVARPALQVAGGVLG